MQRTRRAHYITPVTSELRPARMIYLDSEAHRLAGGGLAGESHLFQLAVTRRDDRAPGTVEGWLQHESGYVTHRDSRALWEWITEQATRRGQTRVWAHNLAYDLRLTRALEHLPELGWEVSEFSIDSSRRAGCWIVAQGPVRSNRNRQTLVLSDSLSWLPQGLERIATDLGHEARPPLPEASVIDPGELEARCRGDVQILAEAVRRIVAWMDEIGAGTLQRTSPGCAMTHYRRNLMPARSILSHDQTYVLELEREAMWTGRAEAWRWGELEGPIDEWDYELAYPMLAGGGLPTKWAGWLAPHEVAERLPRMSLSYLALIRARVTTAVPVLPAWRPAAGGEPREMYWPTGTFETVVWDCELELAREAGAEVEPLEAMLYRESDPLRAWSEWVVAVARDHADPVIRQVAKGWSRTLIGRFGMRYPEWEVFSDHIPEHLGGSAEVKQILHSGEGLELGAMLFVNGKVYTRSAMLEADSSVPAIPSYVAALSRAQLWRTMLVAGLENVCYVDTDSVMTTAAGSKRIRAALKSGALPANLRRKDRYPRVTVFGTRQLLLGQWPRASGLSPRARPAGDGRWVQEVWEGAVAAKAGGRPMVVVDRAFTMRYSDARRRRLEGGATAAYEAGQ